MTKDTSDTGRDQTGPLTEDQVFGPEVWKSMAEAERRQVLEALQVAVTMAMRLEDWGIGRQGDTKEDYQYKQRLGYLQHRVEMAIDPGCAWKDSFEEEVKRLAVDQVPEEPSAHEALEFAVDSLAAAWTARTKRRRQMHTCLAQRALARFDQEIELQFSGVEK